MWERMKSCLRMEKRGARVCLCGPECIIYIVTHKCLGPSLALILLSPALPSCLDFKAALREKGHTCVKTRTHVSRASLRKPSLQGLREQPLP